MSVFDENKLKDEELSGGFLADDSETFSVNTESQKEDSVGDGFAPDKSSQKNSDGVVSKTAAISAAKEYKTVEDTAHTQKNEEAKTNKSGQKVKVITPPIHKIGKKAPKKDHTLWIWFAAVVVVLLILVVVGFYLYGINTPLNFLKNSYVENFSQTTSSEYSVRDVQTEGIIIEETQKGQDEKPEEILELSEGKTPEIAKSSPVQKKVEKQAQTKTKIPVEKKVEKKVTKQQEPEKTKHVKPVGKTETKKKKKPEVKNTPKQEKEVTASKIITKTKSKKKTIRTTPTQKTDIRETLSPTGLFVVEVYSSNSYDEAKIWMDKLNRRNLNASIVTQRICNKIVKYKVRFGRFPTEVDARRMAIKLGFSRFHIDRIK